MSDEHKEPIGQPSEVKENVLVEKKQPLAEHGLLLFGKYEWSNIVVRDQGMAKYINLDPVVVPHSEGKLANAPFIKAKMNVGAAYKFPDENRQNWKENPSVQQLLREKI